MCFAVSGGSWELREKVTAGPRKALFLAHGGRSQEARPSHTHTWHLAPGPLHCSIIFSALLELQPVPGGEDPSLGLLPLTRHQHTCFMKLTDDAHEPHDTSTCRSPRNMLYPSCSLRLRGGAGRADKRPARASSGTGSAKKNRNSRLLRVSLSTCATRTPPTRPSTVRVPTTALPAVDKTRDPGRPQTHVQ